MPPPHRSSDPAFDFGENWRNFSRDALNEKKVVAAAEDFRALLEPLPLAGRTFLDLGFGQGLGLLNAATAGAKVVGCDINPTCAEVLEHNRQLFPKLTEPIPVVVGSILDDNVVQRLLALNADQPYDIVHSWGVLHHTGDMDRAIANAARLVKAKGHLIIAIYNRHWSSPVWRVIKRLYVYSPRWLQRAFVAALFPVIYVAKWIVTGKNPKQQERGMDFHYDVVDWVGGYPYEYATVTQTTRTLENLGFERVKVIAANVPTGCNQFMFERAS